MVLAGALDLLNQYVLLLLARGQARGLERGVELPLEAAQAMLGRRALDAGHGFCRVLPPTQWLGSLPAARSASQRSKMLPLMLVSERRCAEPLRLAREASIPA